MKFEITYQSGPHWKIQKEVLSFQDEQEAEAYADGMYMGGARFVKVKECK